MKLKEANLILHHDYVYKLSEWTYSRFNERLDVPIVINPRLSSVHARVVRNGSNVERIEVSKTLIEYGADSVIFDLLKSAVIEARESVISSTPNRIGIFPLGVCDKCYVTCYLQNRVNNFKHFPCGGNFKFYKTILLDGTVSDEEIQLL